MSETPTSFELVAEGLQFPEGPVALENGEFLVVELARGSLSRVSSDGVVSVVAHLGGAPNGAAIGPDGHCYVCNNGGIGWHRDADGLRPVGQGDAYEGGRIERVDIATGEFDVLYREVNGFGLRGPNDLVFDRHGGFWFTDTGKNRARDMDRGGVYYALADGSRIDEVIHPMATPNGIALSPDGNTLYVAESLPGRIWAFEIAEPGRLRKKPFPSPSGGTLVYGFGGYSLLDSMAVDGAGNICVATLFDAGIAAVSPEGRLLRHHKLPDLYTTNICFGGPALGTAYITLSQSGRLVKMPWPEGGLQLNYGA